MTTGSHNHQGVSEIPKTFDVIYEQPLKTSIEMINVQFLSIYLFSYSERQTPESDVSVRLSSFSLTSSIS